MALLDCMGTALAFHSAPILFLICATGMILQSFYWFANLHQLWYSVQDYCYIWSIYCHHWHLSLFHSLFILCSCNNIMVHSSHHLSNCHCCSSRRGRAESLLACYWDLHWIICSLLHYLDLIYSLVFSWWLYIKLYHSIHNNCKGMIILKFSVLVFNRYHIGSCSNTSCWTCCSRPCSPRWLMAGEHNIRLNSFWHTFNKPGLSTVFHNKWWPWIASCRIGERWWI